MRKTIMRAALIFSLVLCTACAKKELPKEELTETSNPKTDFEYNTALERYGQEIAQRAVDSGEISSVNSIIIKKYIGKDENVIIPETIDGYPVEMIDNFAFSPYNFRN